MEVRNGKPCKYGMENDESMKWKTNIKSALKMVPHGVCMGAFFINL